MLRILGVLTVTLCGIMTARILNGMARTSLLEADALIAFLRFARSEIECFGMPTPQIIRRCPSEILSALGAADAKNMATLAQKSSLHDRACGEILARFCSELGRGYRAEQLSLCDYYIRLAEERRAQIGGNLPSRKKINSALCVAGALAIIIILY